MRKARLFCLLKSCIVFLLWGISPLHGQDSPVTFVDQDSTVFIPLLKALNKTQTKASIDSLVTQVIYKGHLRAGYDIRLNKDSLPNYQLYAGPKYQDIKLKVDSSVLRFMPLLVRSNAMKVAEIISYREKVLEQAISTGYPFAEVWLEEYPSDDGVALALHLDKKQKMQLNDITLEGSAKISRALFKQWTGLEKGQLYNHNAIKRAEEKLKEIPYLKVLPTQITYGIAGVDMVFRLDRKNANKFDILLALNPNNNSVGRYSLDGNANLQLINQFQFGEALELVYQKYSASSQLLNLKAQLPNLLFVPLGIDGHFILEKRDSALLNLNYRFGVSWPITTAQKLSFFVEVDQSDILSIDERQIIQSRRLPDQLDVRNQFLGLAYDVSNLDYLYNPRKGWALNLELALGRRKIPLNQNILALSDPNDADFSFRSLYDTLNLSGLKLRSQLTSRYFIPISRQQTFLLGVRAGLMASNATLGQNELFYLGGAKNLRGYNPRSVIGRIYELLQLEYRYLLAGNSNFYVFTDIGFSHQNGIKPKRLASGGLGLNLETQVGIFAINYAIKWDQSESFDWQSGLIQFGMVSQF